MGKQGKFFNEAWCERIREQMGKLGMNQSELGEYLGRSHQYGHRLWKGDFGTTPDREVMAEIEEVLQLERGELQILAGYLPGVNPKVLERTDDRTVVQVDGAPIIHGLLKDYAPTSDIPIAA